MLNKLRYYFSKKTPFEKKLHVLLGYHPKEKALYRQALTHKSHKKKSTAHNERLEFLGDAILDYVVAELLYNTFQDAREGFLTQMRSKIVNRKSLNKIALQIGINKLVRYHKSAMHQSMYGNALEALIGAIYLDKGHRYAHYFVKNKLLLPNIDLLQLTKEVASYKSKVLEWGQKNKKAVVFKVTSSTGQDHNKRYKVALLLDNELVSEGSGTSIKRAEEQAAEQVKKRLFIE